jgi:hypothetical protein
MKPPHERQAFDFLGKLLWSKTQNTGDVRRIIASLLDGVVDIEAATESEDRNGTDWWVTLRGGARVAIDQKAREPGCSRYWNKAELFGEEGIELAPEIWSSMSREEAERHGYSMDWTYSTPACGWTLSESKNTDYILCTFDPKDSPLAVLIPFQQYRTAFRRFLPVWKRHFKVSPQRNATWVSQCCFVPVWCVLDAIREISVAKQPVESF